MRLDEWIKKTGMPKAEFARRVKVDRVTLFKWLKNKVQPTYRNYLKVKEITNGEVSYEEIPEAQVSCDTTKD